MDVYKLLYYHVLDVVNTVNWIRRRGCLSYTQGYKWHSMYCTLTHAQGMKLAVFYASVVTDRQHSTFIKFCTAVSCATSGRHIRLRCCLSVCLLDVCF
jgi:NADH:ubiquinone oxidoreductase subunit E